MMIEPETWPRVGGTSAGSYRRVAPDILAAVASPGYRQHVTGAKASLDEFHRIAQEIGRKQVLTVLFDRMSGQDGASRRLWRQGLQPGLVCGVVLYGSTLLGRAMASFTLGITKPPVATQIVINFDAALEWATRRVVDGGGPIAC